MRNYSSNYDQYNITIKLNSFEEYYYFNGRCIVLSCIHLMQIFNITSKFENWLYEIIIRFRCARIRTIRIVIKGLEHDFDLPHKFVDFGD